MAQYLLGLDQGSSSSKAVLIDRKGKTVRQLMIPLKTFRSVANRVEQDPIEILRSQIGAAEQLLRFFDKRKSEILGIGITNQRSTLILWDKSSGQLLTPAISWQDLRATGMMPRWKTHSQLIRSKTGLMLTPYYSALKIRWLLENVKGLRSKAEKGRVLCGTVNTYLIWHLTKGEIHATDHSNAARMLLMNLKKLTWDNELLTLFDIPATILPAIHPTVFDYGITRLSGRNIPIKSSIGDQQAGLLGIGAINKGEALINYGTGGFFLVNSGSIPIFIPGLLTSIAWTTLNERTYVVEGTVNSVGTIFDWLKELGLIHGFEEIDRILESSAKSSTENIVFIPSLSGLGSPHWIKEARSAIFGIGPTTRKRELIQAALEGVAFLFEDIAHAIQNDGRLKIKSLSASGGGSQINSLVQIQADFLGYNINRVDSTEASGIGSALLAGVGCGWWKTPTAVPRLTGGRIFPPKLSLKMKNHFYKNWKKSLRALKNYSR